jgi:hypothetical protein
MKMARLATLGMMLGALTVVAIWQAAAQPPDEKAPSNRFYPQPPGNLPLGGQPGFPGGRPDPETDKLRAGEIKADQEVSALIVEYGRTTDDVKRGALKTKLSTALEKQFDLQQQRRDLEASRIEAQLKKLRELMKKRTDARQTIVERRLDQLLREAEGLGWTTPASPSGQRPAGLTLPYSTVPNELHKVK